MLNAETVIYVYLLMYGYVCIALWGLYVRTEFVILLFEILYI